MNIHTREAILEILHDAGSHTVFYKWLFYTERLTGEFERLAHQILGTRVWNTVCQRTGQSPLSLSIADIQSHCSHPGTENESRCLKWTDTPSPGSGWDEFVLDKERYEAAVDLIDDLIAQALLLEADKEIFRKEHTF